MVKYRLTTGKTCPELQELMPQPSSQWFNEDWLPLFPLTYKKKWRGHIKSNIICSFQFRMGDFSLLKMQRLSVEMGISTLNCHPYSQQRSEQRRRHWRRERERRVAPGACLSASECRRAAQWPLQWNADFFLRTSCSSTTMLPLLPPSQLKYGNGYVQKAVLSNKNPRKIFCINCFSENS